MVMIAKDSSISIRDSSSIFGILIAVTALTLELLAAPPACSCIIGTIQFLKRSRANKPQKLIKMIA